MDDFGMGISLMFTLGVLASIGDPRKDKKRKR